MMLSSINNSFEQDTHDVDGNCDGPDLDFLYADTDTYQNEIAELYSYTECSEFQQNVKAFEDQMELYDLPPNWQKLDPAGRRSIVMKLMDQLDVSNRSFRMQAARCILYLAQGCWAEVQSDEEQHHITRENVIVLYELGVFYSFIDLLNMEIEAACSPEIVAVKITNVTLADSTDLRVILSVLYIISETIRDEKEKGSQDYRIIVEGFVQEINSPLPDGELFSVKLLTMITRFCSGVAPHFPMKKVVLLLWKISLLGLGGMDELKRLKMEYRLRAGLRPITEDTLEITRYMRASSPPATANDILDNQNPKRNAFRRMKQRFLDEQEQMDMDDQEQVDYRMFDDPRTGNNNNNNNNNNGNNIATNGSNNVDNHGGAPATTSASPAGDALGTASSAAAATTVGGGATAAANDGGAVNPNNQPNYLAPAPPVPPVNMTTPRLPWTPKVRQKDIDQFLDISRNKFIGYSLINDHESLAGLPQPIHEGVNTLRRHMYVSLADVQIRKEEDIARNPISTHEDEIDATPAELLYQAILPNLPQYMIALLKVLLAASPTSKSKTESINIMSDVLPKKMPITETQLSKLNVDMGRHKEIIVKAVSGIILLYLKHFKINHVYQFEFMSQHLVFANCIPLVLKFFNQTITEYVGMKNTIPLLDFPSCVIGEQPDISGGSFVYGGELTDKPYSWRNVFSCINLLRILNKLIKWKHSRVMMLVVFKSAPILKKTLKVRHAMMQLYVLKLLKMQTKYLGRQWRKSNMKTMSAIYAKVRHRLNDDWAFGNDLESRPWDFQAEECTLRACVDRFNLRRYPEASQKCGGNASSAGAATTNSSNNAAAVQPNNNNNNNNSNGNNNINNSNNNNGENQTNMEGNGGINGTMATIITNSNNNNNNIYNNNNNNNNNSNNNIINNINNNINSNNNNNNNNGNNNYNSGQNLSESGVEGGFPSDEILTHSDFAFFGHSGWWDRKIELSDYFKENYTVWLEDEVYNNQIDWDSL